MCVYSSVDAEELETKAFDYSSRLLAGLRKELVDKFGDGISTELIVAKGDARDEIVDYVESIKADTLILGSRGLGAFKRAFLGSVGDYCVHHCHCPVIVVKHPESPSRSKTE